MSKLNRLFLDQKLFGFFAKLFGRYRFNTADIKKSQFEVVFINKNDLTNSLQRVNLLKDQELVISLEISEARNYKTLCFEVSPETPFNFLYMCITFKFFYQYVRQNTGYEHLVLCASRYQSYVYRTLFGFRVIGWQGPNFFLDFNTKESLQNIWDEYYGTSLEENLYNFVLPVEAGGYVPGNIKVRRPNAPQTLIAEFKKTEKRFYRAEQPRAEIKIGYDLHAISIKDLSENGLSFISLPTAEHPEPPEIQIGHVYSLWVTDNQLNMNWANLSVKIVWQKDGAFGARIVENSPAWKQFIRMMNVKDYQRLTFIDKLIE